MIIGYFLDESVCSNLSLFNALRTSISCLPPDCATAVAIARHERC
jgi:hypothetical protein